MKLAIRYGMPITVGVMLWTIIAHSLVPNPQSIVHSFGAFTFFNILQFTCIFLGLKALEREQRSKPTFKTCLKQGVSISFVYAVTSALFFVGVLLIIGTKWMGAEVGIGVPKWVTSCKHSLDLSFSACCLAWSTQPSSRSYSQNASRTTTKKLAADFRR